ncbi:MAG: sigma factor-like helix-turn-helix DNA-binding protein [Terracidiphilus sp.]
MSAALQLATVWGASSQQLSWQEERRNWEQKPANTTDEPVVSLGFYRRHTESMLRRYLYASMQVGRAPSILGDPVARGWASSRTVRTFEDAVIFVLDLEKCLDQLGSLDRQLLSRIVLQEYTQAEAAMLLGMSVRSVSYKFSQALDRLTEKLLASGLLVLPH